MKTLSLSCLLLVSSLAFGQNSAAVFDKAPPPIDEALRARINQFYQAEMDGKYREAYKLVADDSQDAFLEADKEKYFNCQTVKIQYEDDYTKATVLESCKIEWKFRGSEALATFPITSNWKVVDGQWYWCYVRPKFVPSPFSPTGFVPVPPEVDPKNVSILPTDIKTAAQGILAKVTVDKTEVHLRGDQASQDVVRVRNQMPGQISLHLDELSIPGLKITLGKTQLQANEETEVRFDYHLEDPAIVCVDCAKKRVGDSTIDLRVQPTEQVFRIKIKFEQPQQQP